MDDAAMLQVFKSLLVTIRWPEAIAAFAMVVQAFILLQHRKILREYGDTLVKQAETAKMIGHALEQHGRILADHTRIMGSSAPHDGPLTTMICTTTGGRRGAARMAQQFGPGTASGAVTPAFLYPND